jgi:hypothetical protein
MKRREFISVIGGVAIAAPLIADAQQPKMTVIGFLGTQSAEGYAGPLRAFRQGLKEAGYVEGENLTVEYRWANNEIERLPALANDLHLRNQGDKQTCLGHRETDADHPWPCENAGFPSRRRIMLYVEAFPNRSDRGFLR